MKNETAKNEQPIAANELLKEIAPLLSDCLEGEISLTTNGIFYSMPNGQKFIILAVPTQREDDTPQI